MIFIYLWRIYFDVNGKSNNLCTFAAAAVDVVASTQSLFVYQTATTAAAAALLCGNVAFLLI